MSSAGIRERSQPLYADFSAWVQTQGLAVPKPATRSLLATGIQKTESESHRRNRKTGNYDGGGPFYTSRVSYDVSPGYVRNAWINESTRKYSYTGPFYPVLNLTSEECSKLGVPSTFSKTFDTFDQSAMSGDGTTAISLCNPVNPASNLGTALAEFRREGLPSLPGISTWRNRTLRARSAGDEYLNYEFGWAPLVDEVTNVRDAARNSRDIMNHYHRGEGSNTRRRFDFSSDHSTVAFKTTQLPLGAEAYWESAGGTPSKVLTLTKERKRWFEGCFTYGLPSSTDSWGKLVGIGSQADELFGIALTPDVLWELTPWSWAVDWFSNAGDVVNNVTNFGLAGLVMRYGYMMEETSSIISIEYSPFKYRTSKSNGEILSKGVSSGTCSGKIEKVTKRRVPASPFGFSIGWGFITHSACYFCSTWYNQAVVAIYIATPTCCASHSRPNKECA